MEITDVRRLISEGESQTLEFKRSTAKLKAAAETLCAFLNGQGGRVLIGVSDNRRIVGQEVTDNTKREIANSLKKFEPSANIDVNYLPFTEDKHVIMLTANPDNRSVPYVFNQRPYERKESTTQAMSQNRYQQLILSRNLNPISWGGQIARGITIDKLDASEIKQTIKDGVKKKHVPASLNTNEPIEILKRLNLMVGNGITNAGAVLFLKEIPGDFMQCIIRLARFKGVEKGNFIDSQHIFGNAFHLLTEAERFIHRNTAVASNIRSGKLERLDIPEYPFEAVREGLINAICHRDYASPGGSITLTIYDDRLEIINTGSLPDGVSIDDLKRTHTSHPRNPKIINTFYRRGLIEAMGIGTQEIIKSCLSADMREPEFYEQAGTFVLRLWSGHYVGTESVANKSVGRLNERQSAILIVLRNKCLSPQEILAELDGKISDRTLRRDLLLLKKEGYIDSEGQLGPKTKWYLKGQTRT